MEDQFKNATPIDNALNRNGRPLNPTFKEDMEKLRKALGAVRVEGDKTEIRVIMSLGFLDEPSVLDLDLEEEDEDPGAPKPGGQKGRESDE